MHDCTDLQEAVQDGHSEVQGLLQQLEPGVDLDKPINEDCPHVLSDTVALHVVGTYSLLLLREHPV